VAGTSESTGMRIFDDIASFTEAVGQHLGYSDWLKVDQDRVDAFAEATGDHQWIHVDPERSAAGPYGGTIAHGYLTLSLLPALGAKIYRVDGVPAALNYGLDRVRFPAPVPVGSRVRAGAELVSVTPVAAGGTQAVVRFTVEVEGQDRPACVADTIRRLLV
jgi:acyl dehydratase